MIGLKHWASVQWVQAFLQLVPSQVPLASLDGVVVWSLGKSASSVQVQRPQVACLYMSMAETEATRATTAVNFIFYYL